MFFLLKVSFCSFLGAFETCFDKTISSFTSDKKYFILPLQVDYIE
jgi:hypothetical protein